MARGVRIAVVGKGGSGKSVVAGTLARVLARTIQTVLTLDSDLMPGLSLSLGLGLDSSAMLADAVEKNERGRWRLRKGIGPYRAVMRYAATGPDGVRHLQCGKFDADGLPKILGSVNGFYQVVHRLGGVRSFDEWAIVGDLPAGPRQIVFRWAPYAETFLVLAEPTWKSALTASRLLQIIRSEPPAAALPVACRTRGVADRRRLEKLLGEPVVAEVPLDASVADAERAGVAVIDHAPAAPAVRAIEELAELLLADELGREAA